MTAPRKNKPGAGRPRLNKAKIYICLPQSSKDYVDRLADELSLTRSDAIDSIIVWHRNQSVTAEGK